MTSKESPVSSFSKGSLLDFVTKAHGGLEKWKAYRQVEISLLIRGNLLAYKGISPFKRKMKVTIDTRQVKVVLDPFPNVGFIGIYEGETVTIQNKETSEIVSTLVNARHSCISKMIWGNENLLYFLGYALWNYVNTPYLFHWEGFQVSETRETKVGKNFLPTLEVVYPDSIPTHCKKQTFYFSEKGLLARLDYSAEIFGSFLHGAHICEDHKNFGGFSFATHRIVYPRLGNKSLPFLPSAMEGWVENVEFIL